MPITLGRVVWYVTGRFYLDEHGKLQDLGYFLHLEGVRAALFNGAIGEAGARLTFRSAPFESQPVTNGNISIGLDLKGDFSVYLNPAGGGDFENPDSFSRGTRIAVRAWWWGRRSRPPSWAASRSRPTSFPPISSKAFLS